MPPKPRLHKSTGKSTVNPSTSSSSNETSPNVNPISPELEQQFEVELCWCIQQLQNSLNSGKLNQKQIQDSTKVLNTLMSNSAPMIKKRQVMRMTFGDYRAKMVAEDKKLNKIVSSIKISPASPSKKSVFVKKSLFGSSTGNNFTFNFPEPKDVESSLADNLSNVDIKNCDEKTNFHFTVSNNSFRFNFSNENEGL